MRQEIPGDLESSYYLLWREIDGRQLRRRTFADKPEQDFQPQPRLQWKCRQRIGRYRDRRNRQRFAQVQVLQWKFVHNKDQIPFRRLYHDLKFSHYPSDPPIMPLPLIPIAIGALFGRATKKKQGKEQFQAVRGRKRNDGTTGKPYIRKKANSK